MYAWILRWVAAQVGTPPTLQICIACHFSQEIYLSTSILHSLLSSLFLLSPVSLRLSKVCQLYGEKGPVRSSLCSQSISHITAIYRISLNRMGSSIHSLTTDEKEHQARKQLILSPSLQYLLAIITKRGNRPYYNWLARRRAPWSKRSHNRIERAPLVLWLATETPPSYLSQERHQYSDTNRSFHADCQYLRSFHRIWSIFRAKYQKPYIPSRS